MRIQFTWLAMWSRLERREKKEGGVGTLRGDLEAKDQKLWEKGHRAITDCDQRSECLRFWRSGSRYPSSRCLG